VLLCNPDRPSQTVNDQDDGIPRCSAQAAMILARAGAGAGGTRSV